MANEVRSSGRWGGDGGCERARASVRHRIGRRFA